MSNTDTSTSTSSVARAIAADTTNTGSALGGTINIGNIDESALAVELRRHYPKAGSCGGCKAAWTGVGSMNDFRGHQAAVVIAWLSGEPLL